MSLLDKVVIPVVVRLYGVRPDDGTAPHAARMAPVPLPRRPVEPDAEADAALAALHSPASTDPVLLRRVLDGLHRIEATR